MRPIEFRGLDCKSGNWVYGDIIHGVGLKDGDIYILPKVKNLATIPNCDPLDGVRVNHETVGQFTGLFDKNGTEIYEGDIIEYYETYNYCINPDCEPCIQGYGLGLCKKTDEVQFVDGVFGVEKSEYSLTPLIYCGIREEDISDIKEYAENSAYFDANGYNVDGSIVGIEVIGNIHERKE